MVGTGGPEFLGVDQSLIPALELSQSDGAIQVKNRRILTRNSVQARQRLLRLLRFQLHQGGLVEPAIVERSFLLE